MDGPDRRARGDAVTDLRTETLRLPMADVGNVNPLPPLGPVVQPYRLDTSALPDEMARGIRYGHVDNVMPYLMQDDYDRDRRDGELPIAVLENELLRAEFAVSLGGRLWALTHKPSQTELLYRNRVFQPANLALRNAWFSGGVEWNIGTRGHSPTTCAPVHAGVVDGPGGAPMLRMWQWERLRSVAFQVDAWLDGPRLLIHVKIRNPNDAVTPMYWWSNIAVPQATGTRVVVPATAAYRTRYDGQLDRVATPMLDGRDYSYPARAPHASDFFFDVPDGVRPWIAALDGDGRGLAQVSTGRLRGRKLFVWGQSRGGRHWQDWLSGGGRPYLEIQGGLARTQYEHVPMPAHAEWSWVEAYGLVEADPGAVHGDWAAACEATAAAVDRLASPETLRAALTAATECTDRPPHTRLQAGDGWGALERRRRTATGEPAPDAPGTPFDDAGITEAQQPFATLLATGQLPASDPSEPPRGYVTGADWNRRLAAAPPTWTSLMHLGVAAHARGDHDAARAAYERSLALVRTPWVLRNLALLESPAVRADLLWQAHRMVPDLRQLAVEACESLLAADRPDGVLKLLDAAPEPVRRHGRCQVHLGRAALATGDLERAGEVLEAPLEVPDVREGEIALDALWRDYRAHRIAADRGVEVDDAIREQIGTEPVPAAYDFRMHG
jgi:hypothetical protein